MPENQYFCDGLTEELINRLAQIPQLRVVARTSSFQFKDAARDIREVGRLLDVSKVLEGSVRKAGNRIRATVQLINVSDGCHVWSERYEGDLTDIFAIHEQISTAVGRALQMKMLGGSPAPSAPAPPRSVDAYNHYLQGRFLWKKRTEQGLRAALDHFEQASRLDSSLARAFSGIADCHLMLGLSAAESPDRCMPKAARAASHALKLDPSLAEAHASLAAVKNCYKWDLAAAEAGYREGDRPRFELRDDTALAGAADSWRQRRVRRCGRLPRTGHRTGSVVAANHCGPRYRLRVSGRLRARVHVLSSRPRARSAFPSFLLVSGIEPGMERRSSERRGRSEARARIVPWAAFRSRLLGALVSSTDVRQAGPCR